jgi:hypothetical protein
VQVRRIAHRVAVEDADRLVSADLHRRRTTFARKSITS